MELTIEKFGDVAVVLIHGEHLDASIADEFKSDMTPIIEETHKIVLDMKELRFVDSAGLGAVLSCLRRLGDAGGDLKLCNLTKPVRASFEIARMHRVVEIADTELAAVKAFEAAP
jgi:anti-sigma B factor antagonist